MFDPEKIWTSSRLPTLPAAAVELLELSKDPDSEVGQVAGVIRNDPALAARILQASNSPFYGFRNEITSIDAAVPLLGKSTVTSLALSFSIVDSSMSAGPLADEFKSYWMQSIVQAITAETMARETRGQDAECFQAGLLMDIGRLAILNVIAEDYVPVIEQANAEQRELVEVERQVFGFDHTEIGAKLAENWQLPVPIQKVVAHHHDSTIDPANVDTSADLFTCVALASTVGDYFCQGNKGWALKRLRALAEEFYGWDEETVNTFLDATKQRIDESAQFFNVSSEDLPSPRELIIQANTQLSEMAIRALRTSENASQREKAVEQERSKLARQNEALKEQAFHDTLTKAYNRKYFDGTIERDLRLCLRTSSPIALLFVDVDHFKRFNDTYGHQVGDEVLIKVADAINESVRACDTLARYGGEEFVILVSQPSEPGLWCLAERIRSRIENEPILVDGEAASITASIGGLIGTPFGDVTGFAELMLCEADQAMYDSKRGGRNQVHIRRLSESANGVDAHGIDLPAPSAEATI